jgi:radical SAM protein with 4Fe4S-binding SPASM domain
MAISNNEAFAKDYPLLHRTGLKACLTDSTYMKLASTRAIDVLDHNGKCRDCKYRRFCLGGCRAGGFMSNQGDILGADESICRMFMNGWVHQLVRKIKQLRPTAVCPTAKYFDENGELA